MKKKPERRPSARRTTSRRKARPPSIGKNARPRPASVTDDDKGFTIVGVGASAGGLEAFTALLRKLPPSPGIAVVFVQHLAPQHESALVTLLSGQSGLPVVQVGEGMEVKPDHVYVIPPNRQMVISGLELHISPRPADRTQYNPIDTFLISLARAAGSRAVGVILSGTASDGSLGVRAIRAAGGITIVQTPESAKYDGMPRAAMTTGMVDLVLPPEEIGSKLGQFSTTTLFRAISEAAAEPPLTDAQLHLVFELLRPASSIDFSHYKLPTIKRRLFRRMALHRLTEVDDYIRLIENDPDEVRALSRDLLIHVTRFFREPESFEAMIRDVFPALLEGRPKDQSLRVWVAGCATGEEAYSLAIVLIEFLTKRQIHVPVQLFATDVSDAAVEYARAGVYPLEIEADVTADRLRKFFTKQDGGYRVTKMIRDVCVFARQDLTRDPPFSRLDLILCRNVLIYLDLTLQKKLLSVFHYALNPNGFLVLGQAETVGAHATLFSLADKKYRVHRKLSIATPPVVAFPVNYSAVGGPAKKFHAEPTSAERLLQTEVNRIINDRFAPPGVVVDSEMQIVQFRGQTGAFLEPAPGDASLNLLKMAREGLLYGLRSAVHAARKSRNSVRRTGLQVRAGRGWARVDIEVIPLASTGSVHYLVLFQEPGAARGKPRPAPPPPESRRGKSRLRFLELELAASREYLQSVIQELEAANEELQSANEEILSSNEELQSTNEELDTAKEELQSSNEELNTVNEELHSGNEELSRANSDLLNLLASVQIAIVIVGADLRIRRFTPMAEKVLNLIPADVDRLIAHINPNIEGANLEELITECIEGISPVEREVRDRHGRWYALRIRPYRTGDNDIEGAVLALFDIDRPKRQEASVRAATELAETLMQGCVQPMALLDMKARIRVANTPFVELFHLPRDGYRGQLLEALTGGGSELSRLTASSDGPSGATIAMELRSPHLATSIPAVAHVFPPYDRTSDRMVLLVAQHAPAASSGNRAG